MAVGDVIIAIGTAGAELSFQPATGVEVMLTYMDNEGSAFLKNAVDNRSGIGIGALTNAYNTTQVKIGITNTIYLVMAAVTAKYRTYSGVQTK